jgi:Replication-relaxation
VVESGGNHLETPLFLFVCGAEFMSFLEGNMRRRVGQRGLAALASELSERDMAVVSAVVQHRFMTARQIEAWHFTNHATALSAARVCRRVLERLTASGVLRRLKRRIGGVRAGSASYVYGIGPVGDRLFPGASRRRANEPSELFLDHTLGIVDARLALLNTSRLGAFELIDVETEPECWRRFDGSGGAREILRPDLFAVTASGELEHCWFIEFDRATASLPAVVNKCRQYAAYFRSGIEQQHLGTFPLVVWATISEGRAGRIRWAIDAARTLPSDLFRVCLASEIAEMVAGGGS